MAFYEGGYRGKQRTLGYCGFLGQFRATFSYILLYATFLEKEPVKSSIPVEGCFSALPGDGFITELLMSIDSIFPIFSYCSLIRDFTKKSFRINKTLSNFFLVSPLWLFIEGVYRGNSAAASETNAANTIY